MRTGLFYTGLICLITVAIGAMLSQCSTSIDPISDDVEGIKRDSLSLGDATAIAVDSEGRIVAGATEANMYRSTDQGETWIPVDLSYLVLRTLWTAPRGAILASILFWDSTFSYHVQKTDDGGAHWERLDTPDAYFLSFYSGGSDTIFAGTNQGIWASADSGATWEFLGLDSLAVVGLARSPGGQWLAITSGTLRGAIYRKSSSHEWDRLLGTAPLSCLLIGVDGTVLIGRQYHDEAPGGALLSDDLGETWREIPDLASQWVFELHEVGPGVYLAGTSHGVFRTTTSGQQWEPVLTGWFVEDFAKDPNTERLYAAVWRIIPFAEGGGVKGTVLWSDDEGKTWE